MQTVGAWVSQAAAAFGVLLPKLIAAATAIVKQLAP